MPGVVIGAGAATRLTRALEVDALVMSEDGAPRARGRSVKMVVGSERRIVAIVAVFGRLGRLSE